jgi:hypothetical protein
MREERDDRRIRLGHDELCADDLRVRYCGAVPQPHDAGKLCAVVATVGRDRELVATMMSMANDAGKLIGQVIIVFDGVAPRASLIDDLSRLAWCPMIVAEHDRRPAGPSRCRRVAMSYVMREFVAFLDDDTEPTESWANAVQAALARGWTSITGVIVGRDRTVLSRARHMRYRQRYEGLRTGDRVSFVAGGNSVMATALLREHPGFMTDGASTSESLGAVLAARGKATRFVADMAVRHVHDRGWRSAIANAWRAGKVQGRTALTSWPAVDAGELGASVVNVVLWCICVTSSLRALVGVGWAPLIRRP